MNDRTRLEATRYIWIAYGVAMFALMIGYRVNGESLGAGHVVIAGATSIGAFLSTGSIWGWGDADAIREINRANNQSAEADERMSKRKNEVKLDALLSRLSVDELETLRDRIRMEQDDDYYDDGEIVNYRC